MKAKVFIALAVCLILSAMVFGQQGPPRPPRTSQPGGPPPPRVGQPGERPQRPDAPPANMKRPDGPPNPQGPPPPPPNARFIGAELRFGDKLVKGQPFSADTLIEDTRLLFDGTTVKKSTSGAVYRDSIGRTRREQPLDMVGGFNVVGAGDKSQTLVFINDFDGKVQYFLDQENKIARRTRIPGSPPEFPERDERPDVKTIADGSRTIEGISCNLTRTEFEIPVGQVGNEKPLKVFSERCFSPELQVVIMSLHNDPVSGIHLFKLTNIRRAEPSSDLFIVPTDYRVENPTERVPDRPVRN